MSHLKLVETRKVKRPAAPTDAARPAPTDDFLVRRVRALNIGTETIGELLDEAKALYEAGITSLDRISEITDKLMSAGIYLIEADEEADTIPDGVVAYPRTLIKLHKELARHDEQLGGLALTLR